MCPRLGVYLALELFLDSIVSDRRGCIECVVDISLREASDEPCLHSVVRPHAGVTVSLQL